MKLSKILANPIKLKGGGNLDLKGLSKVIIDKEVGDNFPYEHQVVNFTVDVKAENWSIEEGSASCTIKFDNPIPLQHTQMIWGILNNNAPSDIEYRRFQIPIAELSGEVSVDINYGKIVDIYIEGYYEEPFTPQENYKFEFKNLIFV